MTLLWLFLERVIQSIERVIADGHIPGDWERRAR